MKVAILLSGGVDSSVALRLLKEQGHDITAFYLKIWLQEEYSFLGDCPWEEDLEFARAVCEQANVPLQVIPLQDEYWDRVVSYTIKEIKDGRTPNPDMFCNSLVKFGAFLDKIDASYEKVASGHYATLEERENRFYLKRSPDAIKDQTYFLAYLKQQQLARALFPIGIYEKKQVRQLAKDFELPNQARKDSQGICFLGKIKFKDFVKEHLGELPGDIVNFETMQKMGTHPGYYYYTIGQREGIGLNAGPWYVVRKDIVNNIIYISQKKDVIASYRDSFNVTKLNWLNDIPASGAVLHVKIRHGAHRFPCVIEYDDPDLLSVKLQGSDKGIAAGQFAVFYNGDYCLGGGIITDSVTGRP
jgi:tRNA-5-taurinomethyluridine 2-sulfurtransferase